MTEVTHLTPDFAVAKTLRPEDFAELKAQGFKTIISNLPDGEDDSDIASHDAAKLAWQQGLTFRFLPADKMELFSDDLVGGMEDALRGLDGPVIAYCRSGMRSAIVWAAASARNQPVDCVLAALSRAGFDFDFLTDDLEEQAALQRWVGTAPLLDCSKATEVSRPEQEAVA